MKRFFKYLILFFVIISCSGCVKYEENMEIKNNKHLNLTLVVATNSDSVKKEIFNENEINNLKKFYSISKYDDKKYSGYKLMWNISNIDKVSSTSSNIVYSLTSIRDSVPTNIFKVNKGFFTNTYYADFTFDPSTIEELDKVEKTDDLLFSLNIDNGCIDNNADVVSNDGKKFSWNLSNNDITEINFSFTMINYSKIILTILFGLIIFSLMVYSTRKILEKRV